MFVPPSDNWGELYEIEPQRLTDFMAQSLKTTVLVASKVAACL